MKELKLSTTIKVYEEAAELEKKQQDLLQAAKSALELSYSPYSRFKVGAAILLANGETVLGSNQENAAYTMCICAERVALAAASSTFPNIPILSMAVTVKHREKVIKTPASPCGACRQVIRETEIHLDHPIEIILQGEAGEIYVFKSGEDLLPLSFDNSFLQL